jgi:hypothetical protein
MELPGKLSMKLLVNDKELANYLTSLIDLRNFIKEVPFLEVQTTEAISYALTEKNKGMGKWNKKKHKIKDKIKSGIEKDLREYVSNIKLHLKNNKEIYYQSINRNISKIITTLGQEEVLKNYRNSKFSNGFIKGTGLHIDPNAELIRRYGFDNVTEDCLLRNTVGNEKFLTDKIDQSLPFWFIDSGYTNFLESNKKWHRLVRNHLHYGNSVDVPVDRLGVFKTFPQPWRTSGDKILVIEPGQFAANIFHIDIKNWKYQVEDELRKYTDKKIVFREKSPKKKRSPLYRHLLDEDYYCIININSNAATESIWAGIPTITLDKHITNPVSKNQLSDINNLYRGSLANWLAVLSYSQFTYEELIDGTAVNIIKKYHV